MTNFKQDKMAQKMLNELQEKENFFVLHKKEIVGFYEKEGADISVCMELLKQKHDVTGLEVDAKEFMKFIDYLVDKQMVDDFFYGKDV